jgi:hypothetical protein
MRGWNATEMRIYPKLLEVRKVGYIFNLWDPVVSYIQGLQLELYERCISEKLDS